MFKSILVFALLFNFSKSQCVKGICKVNSLCDETVVEVIKFVPDEFGVKMFFPNILEDGCGGRFLTDYFEFTMKGSYYEFKNNPYSFPSPPFNGSFGIEYYNKVVLTKSACPNPTSSPTLSPTNTPTLLPTTQPTSHPSISPTVTPSSQPTSSPTAVPTTRETMMPSAQPTPSPTPDCDIKCDKIKCQCPCTWEQHKRSSNGCGPGWFWEVSGYLSDMIKPRLRSACDLHDLCWSTCGRDKQICDNDFFLRMSKVCLEFDATDSCWVMVKSYYDAVSASFPIFLAAQLGSCNCTQLNTKIEYNDEHVLNVSFPMVISDEEAMSWIQSKIKSEEAGGLSKLEIILTIFLIFTFSLLLISLSLFVKNRRRMDHLVNMKSVNT